MNESDRRSPSGSHQLNPGLAALWASAFVIMALIIVQAGRLHAGQRAQASVTADIVNLRLLTSRSNVDEEVLSILDENDETLSAYLVVNGRSLELFDIISLPDAFARAAGGARR